MIDLWNHLTLSQRLLASMLLGLGGFMVWFHYRRGREYDVLDILIDQQTKRASLDAHVTMLFALLACWWIIDRTMADVDVGSKLVDVLMIFVIYRAANKAINAYSQKPPAPVIVPPAPDAPTPVQIDMTQNAGGEPAEQGVKNGSRPKSQALAGAADEPDANAVAAAAAATKARGRR